MHSYFRLRLGLMMLSLFSFVISCKKDKNEDPREPSLISLKLNVTPYEIALLEAKNIELDKETYPATLDDKEVTLGQSDGNLAFIVPETSAGDHVLKVNIANKDYTLTYHVAAAPPVADPGAYVREKVSGLQLGQYERDSMKARLAAYPGAQDVAQQLDKLQTIYADMNAAVANATAEELRVAAGFMAANPGLFSRPALLADLSGLELFKTTAGSDNPEALLNDLDQEIINAVAVATAGAISTGLIIRFAPGQWKAIGAITGGATAGFIFCFNAYMLTALNRAIDRFNNLSMRDILPQKNTTADLFTNGATYNLAVVSEYRNLNSESMGSSSAIIRSIASSLDGFGKQWDKVLGMFPEWLVGKPYHFKNITTVRTKVLPVNAQYLDVKNISNSKVTVTVDRSNGKFLVKFTSSETADQDFSYDVVYNAEGYESHTETFSGKLVKDGSGRSLLKHIAGESGNYADFTYDNTGKLTVYSSPLVTVTLNWSTGQLIWSDGTPKVCQRNAAGYVVSATSTGSGSTDRYTFTYDAENRLVKQTDTTDISNGTHYYRSETYTWANDNLVTAKVVSGNTTTTYSFTYDANKPQRVDVGAKFFPAHLSFMRGPAEIAFNQSKNVLKKYQYVKNSQTTVIEYNYQFDSRDRISKITGTTDGVSFEGTTYTYFD